MPTQPEPSDFPMLSSLQLTSDDLRALSDQGFVSQEHRRDKTYYKLRFRVDGRQRVKYVSATKVTALAAELATLQSSTLCDRKLMQLTRNARRALRDAKSALVPHLRGGFYFHGHAIRQRRVTEARFM